MPVVFGYACVSPGDQDLGTQHRFLQDEAGATRVFDDVLSSDSFNRPGLNQMLGCCGPGDIICVVRLDRLSRSLTELLRTLEMFKVRGLAFRSLEENLDTTSANGELIFHVFGAMAQFERRPRDGNASARREGRPALDDDKLASALELVEKGIPPAQAAEQIGLGRSTLYRKLAQLRSQSKQVPAGMKVTKLRCD
jgi:DNA invertase Pin-like site-specific DNA recombinase